MQDEISQKSPCRRKLSKFPPASRDGKFLGFSGGGGFPVNFGFFSGLIIKN